MITSNDLNVSKIEFDLSDIRFPKSYFIRIHIFLAQVN